MSTHNGVNMNLKIGLKAVGNFQNFNKNMTGAINQSNKFQVSLKKLTAGLTALGAALGVRAAVNKLADAFQAISGIKIPSFSSLVEESIEVSKNFADAEAKLKALLVHTSSIGTTGAGAAAERLIQLAANTESAGVVAQEVLESGLQQMSTFQMSEAALTQLTPLMADLLAQQYGVNATQNDAVTVANLIGKGMSGMTGALTRVGIVMNDEQKALIQNGDAQTKLATMVDVLNQNVGGVNKSLAENTAAGKEANFQFQIAAMMRDWGDKFMEMRLTIIDTIKPYLPAIKQAMDAVIDVVGGVIKGACEWLDKNKQNIQSKLTDVVSRIRNFADKVTPETITGFIDRVVEKLDLIIKVLKGAILAYAVASMTSSIMSFGQGLRLRSALPVDITSAAAIEKLSAGQMAQFNTLNALRNQGGAAGTSAVMGANIGKLFARRSAATVAATATATDATALLYSLQGGGAAAGAAGGTAAGGGLVAALTNPVTIGALIVAVTAGLNAWIKKTFGSGEELGRKLARILTNAISSLYNLLLDVFDSTNFAELMFNIIKNAVQFVFDTLPGILVGFVAELATAIHDAIFGGGDNNEKEPGYGFGSISTIHQNALGTPYAHGVTTINERGGEIMRLPSGTAIIPADKSAALLDKQQQPTVVVNIQGNVIGNREFIDYMGNALVNEIQLAYLAG